MKLKYKPSWHELVRQVIDDLVQKPGMVLPGIQAMQKQYNASRRTVEHALLHLEKLGIVEAAERGRRRNINLSKLRRIASQQGRMLDNQVLFISIDPASNPTYVTRDIYESMHKLCEQEGLRLTYLEAPSDEVESRALLTELNPRGVILVRATKQVADIVASLKLPAVGIGASFSQIPAFHTSHYKLVIHAIQQARAAGHQRITAPCWNTQDDVYSQHVASLDDFFSDEGMTFSPRYNFPDFHGESAKDYCSALGELFRYTPPTCIILNDLSHYLSASSFFLSKRLMIPDDISVILLSQDSQLVDVTPSIAHFVLYSEQVIQQAFHVLNEQIEGLPSYELDELVPSWVPGASLAPPKAS